MNKLKDLRFKLTDEQKEKIRQNFLALPTSQNLKKLAGQYNVSLTTIRVIVNPDYALKQIKPKGRWKKYYSTKKAFLWKKTFRERKERHV